MEHQGTEPRLALDPAPAKRTTHLRWLAIAGVLLAVVADLTRIPAADLEYQAMVVILLTIATFGVLAVCLRQNSARLLQNIDLLVPLGIATGLQELIVLLAQVPPLSLILEPATQFSFLNIAFVVSLSVLLSVVIWVAYGVWTLVLIVGLIRDGSIDLGASFAKVRRHGLRVFLLMAIVMSLFFACVGVVLGLAPSAMPLALFLIFVLTLFINFATAGLLLRAVAQPQESLVDSLRNGIRASFAGARRWWLPLLAQMELTGLICFVSYSKSSSFNQHSATNFSINGKWTGSFESSSSWLSKAAEVSDSPEVTLLTTFVALLIGTLAVIMKLRIAQGLKDAGELEPLT